MRLVRSVLTIILLFFATSSAVAQASLEDRLAKIPGYAKKLREAVKKQKTVDGLTIDVRVVPDGYTYRMARGIEELVKAGYGEKRLRRDLYQLHKKHEMHRNRYLVIVRLTSSEDQEHFFPKKKKVFSIRQKKSQVFTILEWKPKVDFAQWQVFQYPPNHRRLINKHKLARFDKLSVLGTSRSLKTGSKDPLVITINHLLRQTQSRSAKDSVNVDARQISCIQFRDLLVPEMEMTFYPGRWQVPEPPPELVSVLAELAKK